MTEIFINKKVAVFGLGISGQQCALFLKKNGAVVVGYDDKVKFDKIDNIDLNTADLTEFDFIVVSPGIPNHHPICVGAIKQGVPLIGEVELLWQSNPNATYIGITGTNGKSTTTALISHILTGAGVKNCVGGNFGTPAVALEKSEVYILEMSSYMLERIPNMNFDIGVFLNITPDHLSWHETMDNYYNAKKKIFNNMSSENVAVICNDDEYGKKLEGEIATPKKVIVSKNDITKSYQYLSGDHNNQNIACAVAVCKSLNIDDDVIESGINSFTGLKHRQQFVAEIDNNTFINDSKATNPTATEKALSAYNNIYWIAGGEKKSDDFTELDTCISNVKKAFLIGVDANAIGSYLDNKKIPYEISNDMDTATKSAHSQAGGNVILLSPACASFDQFKNFEDRGDKFIEIVKDLQNG